MRGAGRIGAFQDKALSEPVSDPLTLSNTPHPPLRGTFSHKGRRTSALFRHSSAIEHGCETNRVRNGRQAGRPILLPLWEKVAAPKRSVGEVG